MHYTQKEINFLNSLISLPEKEQGSFLELFAKETKRTFTAIQRKYKRLSGIYITNPAILKSRSKKRKYTLKKGKELNIPTTDQTKSNISFTIKNNISFLDIIETYNPTYYIKKALENILIDKNISEAILYLEKEFFYENNK